MAVSDGLLNFVLEQLEPLGEVTARRMFGGAGLYAGDVFFAVVDDDMLFFKVDETNVGEFIDAGMAPWQPYPDKPATPRYYQVPVGVLEDRDQVVAWAKRAVDVGRRGASRKRRPAGRNRRRRPAV
jgi:DNA transformation protein